MAISAHSICFIPRSVRSLQKSSRMVAEQLREDLQNIYKMSSSAANPAVDTALLLVWVGTMDGNMVAIDGRLDMLDYAQGELRGQVAEINSNLHVTIEQAKGALNGIVSGVRQELVGVHHKFQQENKDKLDQLMSLFKSKVPFKSVLFMRVFEFFNHNNNI